MLQLRHLRTFLAAADSLSFTQAAQRVHLSQPSVTEQIQALEHSVGQALFVRDNNRLTLTPTGQRLAERARELLVMADDALRAARDETSEPATLQVAAPQALCLGLLVPSIAAHAASHPSLRVALLERHSAATAKAVLDGEADLGVVHGWPAAGNDLLQVKVIARDRPVVVLPVSHALTKFAQIEPSALADAPLIVTVPGCCYRAHLEALLQQHATTPPAYRAEADSVPAMLRMVATGLGVAVLPARAVGQYDDGSVAVRPLAGGGDGLPICLLHRRDRPMRPAVAEFARRLSEGVSDQPVPALDMQHRAGGVAIADQEADRIGDVLCAADAADRQPLGHRRQ
jgi:DNA-binding transcriptional LysR family regulator